MIQPKDEHNVWITAKFHNKHQSRLGARWDSGLFIWNFIFQLRLIPIVHTNGSSVVTCTCGLPSRRLDVLTNSPNCKRWSSERNNRKSIPVSSKEKLKKVPRRDANCFQFTLGAFALNWTFGSIDAVFNLLRFHFNPDVVTWSQGQPTGMSPHQLPSRPESTWIVFLP